MQHQILSPLKETEPILDSGSNIISIPEDIAEWLEPEIKQEEKTIETGDGKRKEKIKITENVSFKIIDDDGKYVRYDNERAKIAPSNTSILIGTIPVFQNFNVIFKARKKLTILILKL